MKLEQQVTSLELSKRLKELGVKQESYFFYSTNDMQKRDEYYELSTVESMHEFYYPLEYSAFTVAELGEMLREGLITFAGSKRWIAQYKTSTVSALQQMENTEADARAKMLIYLIENNLLK